MRVVAKSTIGSLGQARVSAHRVNVHHAKSKAVLIEIETDGSRLRQGTVEFLLDSIHEFVLILRDVPGS